MLEMLSEIVARSLSTTLIANKGDLHGRELRMWQSSY